VRLHLAKTSCIPLLVYCICVLDLSHKVVSELLVGWNDCFRNFFCYNRWESASMLQYFLGELSFERIYDLYSWNFYNDEKGFRIVRLLMNFQLHSSVSTVDMLSVKYGRVSGGFVERKNMVYKQFASQCQV
jgi:hypothetical protein